MDDAAKHPEHDDAGDDLIAELQQLIGQLPPHVVERAADARRPE